MILALGLFELFELYNSHQDARYKMGKAREQDQTAYVGLLGASLTPACMIRGECNFDTGKC